ncbi:MAG: carbohydrate-binding family 9-like protein, partial [Lentisphaeria bacterium]|nr:carbohydrate-binding family 9-like protein [Lentisphaeria bacterium]
PEAKMDARRPGEMCQVRRVVKPVAVDGVLAPGEWDHAVPLVLTHWWPKQTGVKQKTTVRLLWDDEALYVCYQCEDVDITAVLENRDDPTYNEDCCEIFIMPNPTRKPTAYIGLEMSARGVLFDYFCSSGVALLKRFDLQDCALMTKIDGTLNARGDRDKGWVLEVRIPFANFDGLTRPTPPAPGAEWRVQLCRWDGVAPDRALSLWTNSEAKTPNPHRPDRFGWLVFAAPPRIGDGE